MNRLYDAKLSITDCFHAGNAATEPGPPTEQKKDNTYIGVIIGALSALLIILAVVVTAVFARQRRKKLKYSGSPLKMFIGHDHINFNMSDVPSDKVGLASSRYYSL